MTPKEAKRKRKCPRCDSEKVGVVPKPGGWAEKTCHDCGAKWE